MSDKNSLLSAFKDEISSTNQMTFPICVDSFTNLWEYEFGSLEDLPKDVDHIIAKRALELGLMDSDF
ncbi:hypothetical protein IMZ08_10065 [Bacillus luteolus]|uniref:Uncharacterized protein n=1 Tax=Litchfieldia luteola TaxID=682179 RepID=A0ABR9QIT1_9BACI|nr:hypothetical protein [Cytobacillus luteolus]MBE4908402.1 hypothetical protein [Cytobacillus luteolus]MBP1943190.1 hypothetical protein [Cytobacillus luteolus]